MNAPTNRPGLIIRKGTQGDALSLAPRLRGEDALELSLSAGPDLAGTLTASVEFSVECWAVEEGGAVIALGGICLAPGTRIGIPWLVGSPEVLRHPRELVSLGREAVSRWEPLCDVLTNLAHAENAIHLRWLKRIGFTLAPTPIKWGVSKAPFIQFYRYSK